MRNFTCIAVLCVAMFSVASAPARAAGLSDAQASAVIAVVQSSPGTPASDFVSLITAFSNATENQARSLIAVVQSSPSTSANIFVNLLTSFTNDSAQAVGAYGNTGQPTVPNTVNPGQGAVPVIPNATTPPITGSGLAHYGFVYFGFNSANNDLDKLSAYTSTIVLNTHDEASLARAHGFKDIVLGETFETDVLPALMAEEGITAYATSTYDFRTIPNYETKALSLWRQKLQAARADLASRGLLGSIGEMYISDEPALHRNYIPDQAFLDSIASIFKEVFPDTKSTMAFAEDRSASADSFRGPHLNPPPALDFVTVDPYFWNNTTVSCSKAAIQEYLYQTNPNSTIDWALQFGKPVWVAGDAMLRNGADPLPCYVQDTYDILKADKRISGLVWFIYNKDFGEGSLVGAANSPTLISEIRGLTIGASATTTATAAQTYCGPQSTVPGCAASIKPSVVNGSCAALHYGCTSGTSASNVSGANAYTWSCQGANGGTTASCSEPKGCTYNGLVQWTSGANSCSANGSFYAPNGGSATVSNTVSGRTGSATYWCSYSGGAYLWNPNPSNISCALASASTATNPAAPSITSFSLNGTNNNLTVPAGTPVNISWATTNVASCTINYGGSTAIGPNSGTSPLTVNTSGAAGSYTYILTCTGINGGTTSASRTLATAATTPTAPAINDFSLNGQNSDLGVPAGTSVSLTWHSVSTTGCTINYGGTRSIGSNSVSPLVVNTQGSSPGSSYTYHLTCSGVDGTTVTATRTLSTTAANSSTNATANITSNLNVTSLNPTISGTAAGTAYVAVLISNTSGFNHYAANTITSQVTSGQWTTGPSYYTLSNGTYTVKVYSANFSGDGSGYGNNATPLATGTLLVNVTSSGTPTATLDQPNQTTTSGRPVISGTANVGSVYVNYLDSNGKSISGTGAVTVTNGTWSASQASSLPNLVPGTYALRVYDSATNILLTSGTLTVQ